MLWSGDSAHDLAPGRDYRVLPIVRDRRGVKRLPLLSALAQLRLQSAPDWPLRGPKAVLEFLAGIEAAGLHLPGHYGHWQRQSGVHWQSGAAMEFLNLQDLLRHRIIHDQVDVSNALGAEIAACRCHQIQRAVRRSPCHLNLDGLDTMFSSAFDEMGGVVATKFDIFVATPVGGPHVGKPRDDAERGGVRQAFLCAGDSHSNEECSLREAWGLVRDKFSRARPSRRMASASRRPTCWRRSVGRMTSSSGRRPRSMRSRRQSSRTGRVVVCSRWAFGPEGWSARW